MTFFAIQTILILVAAFIIGCVSGTLAFSLRNKKADKAGKVRKPAPRKLTGRDKTEKTKTSA